MLKKPITYTDFDGETRTETFYFNLTKAELMELALQGADLEKSIRHYIEEENTLELFHKFKEVVSLSYGFKSEDGRQFLKDESRTKAFLVSEPFSVLFLELISDAATAAEFIKAVLPSDVDFNINQPTLGV